MKKSSLLILCLTYAFVTYAQENNEQPGKSKIGLTYSGFGESDIARFQLYEGGPGFYPDKFYTVGIDYLLRINGTFDFETGIEYSKHKIIVHPESFPNTNESVYGAQFFLINVPLTIRVNFLKYCFLNGGLNLDIDPTVSSPIDNQTGIGAILGLGLKYDADFGISVFVNPYLKTHSLIPFSSIQDPQRVLESGFRFGLLYKLK